MSEWKPTPECNDRCYGEDCVHRGKKPGFWGGLLAGIDAPETDSDNVVMAKAVIRDLNLTRGEKADIAGWLMGDALIDSISEVLGDKPLTE